jgi:FkbM family methyltransferase
MGHLKHKYTKEYFTGKDSRGNKLNYGVEGFDAFLNGHIREIDLSVLKQINFQDKNVLEFGFGRGEAIKYGIEHGSKNYIAVDFAISAKKIAQMFLKSVNINNAKIYCDDALSFLKKYIKDPKNKNIKFDIVLMFDFVEHVPREELKELFKLLKKVIKDTTIVAINTPNYKFDNDVIKNGLDQRNNIDSVDTSDLNEATSGMHCNKYSTVSLQAFMKKNGYLNITEQHFYIPTSKIGPYYEYKSYHHQWNECFTKGFPLTENYINDIIETPNQAKEKPDWRSFSKGTLKNIDLYLTPTYYKDVFPNGNYDKELFEDFEKSTNNHETIFDVGGFMGIDSLIFSKIVGNSGKIITFEPNPFNLNRLLLNFSRNTNQSKNISAFCLGLGETVSEAKFLLSDSVDNGFSSTSRLEGTHVEHTPEHLKDLGFFYQQVNIDTLDQFVERTGLYPNVIKIDIEGAEHLFLLGARKFLNDYSPVLYIELHSQFCALTCTEILSTLGYSNIILFEEPDNRILVKYFKEKNDKNKISSGIGEIETKIYRTRINKLEEKIKLKDAENSMLLTEKNSLIDKTENMEKYLNKLINNPVIKAELKIFSLLKKTRSLKFRNFLHRLKHK